MKMERPSSTLRSPRRGRRSCSAAPNPWRSRLRIGSTKPPRSIGAGSRLESVYDGVHGWSGTARRTAPMIAPGASFVVRLTPPRAGTFIYHTHLHDYRQLSSGLYGALVVTDGDGPYDPTVDHVIVLGRRDASEASSVLEDRDSIVVNGDHAPRFVWRAGHTHRLRLINITPDDVLQVALIRAEATTTWRPVAKDGAPLSTGFATPVPATVRLAVGETVDVEFDTSAGPGVLWLEVRTPQRQVAGAGSRGGEMIAPSRAGRGEGVRSEMDQHIGEIVGLRARFHQDSVMVTRGRVEVCF